MNFKGEKANNFNGLKALLPSRYIDTGGNIDLVRKYIVYSDLDKKTVEDLERTHTHTQFYRIHTTAKRKY